jgi:NAD(P)-dependent dehydrogenase (short-subunit alcohol dehydrogenase family)
MIISLKRLNGKVAIVTGGATGIGEAISKKFAMEGAKVIVCSFPEDPVDHVCKEILDTGGEAMPFSADISLAANAKACVDMAAKLWGRLDILINNAGVFPIMEVTEDYPEETFDYLMKNNVRSAFMMTKYALPELQKTKGCIVSAGSEAGIKGLGENAPYGGTKGWMHAFMRGVAVEQAKHGVRANCVCPGAIDTAWTHKETGPMSKQNEKMIIQATPLGRRGTPEEIANAYLFLASDEASYVTGALFSVDGGITIGKGAIGEQAPKDVKKEPDGTLDLRHTDEGATDMSRGSSGGPTPEV